MNLWIESLLMILVFKNLGAVSLPTGLRKYSQQSPLRCFLSLSSAQWQSLDNPGRREGERKVTTPPSWKSQTLSPGSHPEDSIFAYLNLLRSADKWWVEEVWPGDGQPHVNWGGLQSENPLSRSCLGSPRQSLIRTAMNSHSCISCLGRGPIPQHQQLVGPIFKGKFIVIISQQRYKRINWYIKC